MRSMHDNPTLYSVTYRALILLKILYLGKHSLLGLKLGTFIVGQPLI